MIDIPVGFDFVRDPIDRALRSVGFRTKSKRFWHRETPQVFQVVHLDKSSYGPQNRVEVFFSLNQFINKSNYNLGDFDIKLNFDRIVQNSIDFRNALDQEKAGMPPEARSTIIQTALAQHLYPIIDLAINENGLSRIRELIPNLNDLYILPRTASILKHLQTLDPLK